MKIQTELAELSALDQAYAALRESDDRFRELAEHVRDVFWLADTRTGNFLYANPAYNSLTSLCRDALYDNPQQWFGSVHPDDLLKVESAWGTIGNEFDGWSLEYRLVRNDGSVRWVHERAFPVRALDGVTYRIAGITEDITLEREQKQRLRQLTHDLDVAYDQQRKEFVEILHDEISQDLVVAKFALDRLKHDLPPEALSEIEQASRSINKAIDSTRSLTAGLNSGLYELGFWSELKLYQEELAQSGVTLELQDDCPDVELSERAAVSLYRSIRELLHNSLKHSDADITKVARSVVGDQLRLEIADNGAGFDVDFALSKPNCSGLILIQERIWSLGGTFSIKSGHNLGTRVIIRIPLARAK